MKARREGGEDAALLNVVPGLMAPPLLQGSPRGSEGANSAARLCHVLAVTSDNDFTFLKWNKQTIITLYSQG